MESRVKDDFFEKVGSIERALLTKVINEEQTSK
jgi:hypothetical protein